MRLSIITTVFGDRAELYRTICSLRAQTYCEWEHIIVDANPRREESECFQEHLLDRKVRYINIPSVGIYAGMNHGISLASGAYFQILNAGTTYFDDLSLETFVNFANARSGERALVACRALLQFRGGNVKLTKQGANTWPRNACHEALFFPLWKEEVIMHHTDMGNAADFDFILRYSREVPLVFAEFPLIIYKKGGVSDQSTFRSSYVSYVELLKRNKGHMKAGFRTYIYSRISKDFILMIGRRIRALLR